MVLVFCSIMRYGVCLEDMFRDHSPFLYGLHYTSTTSATHKYSAITLRLPERMEKYSRHLYVHLCAKIFLNCLFLNELILLMAEFLLNKSFIISLYNIIIH